jgi:hypothetical protein
MDYVQAKNLQLTKPWANPNNAIKLYGVPNNVNCDSLYPNFYYTYDSNAATLTITGSFGATGLNFMSFRVRDEKGNQAFAQLNPASPSTAIVIDVSALNAASNWSIQVTAESNSDNCNCENDVIYDVEVVKTGTAYTAFRAPVAAFRVLQHNGTTETAVTADGQTVTDVVNIAQNAAATFNHYIKNTGSGTMTVSNVVIGASGTIVPTAFPKVLAPGEEATVVITLTTSVLGANTATVQTLADAVNLTPIGGDFNYTYAFTVV